LAQAPKSGPDAQLLPIPALNPHLSDYSKGDKGILFAHFEENFL
jgi:hypothetical protein